MDAVAWTRDWVRFGLVTASFALLLFDLYIVFESFNDPIVLIVLVPVVGIVGISGGLGYLFAPLLRRIDGLPGVPRVLGTLAVTGLWGALAVTIPVDVIVGLVALVDRVDRSMGALILGAGLAGALSAMTQGLWFGLAHRRLRQTESRRSWLFPVAALMAVGIGPLGVVQAAFVVAALFALR